LEALVSFIEERLSEFSAPRGDEQSFRLLDETRDKDLANAEEKFFSQVLLREIADKPNQRLLLLDAGGSPRLASKLLAALPSQVQVGYVRLDPNPASLAVSRSLNKVRSARFLLVDPARAALSDADWSYIKRSSDSCVLLAAGCAWNAFLSQQQRFVEQFFQRATLSLASFLLPERLALIQRRLAAVQAKGALFDKLRLRPILAEDGQLIHQEEISWSLSAPPPALSPLSGYYQLSVAIQDNPSFPLVNLHSLDYLQGELFAGFRFYPGPIAGEGQLFSLRYTH
jgi:hypothetical protein